MGRERDVNLKILSKMLCKLCLDDISGSIATEKNRLGIDIQCFLYSTYRPFQSIISCWPDNSTVRMAAMNKVKEDMASVSLADPELPHPILYNFMYIQWEANEVREYRLYKYISYGSIQL